MFCRRNSLCLRSTILRGVVIENARFTSEYQSHVLASTDVARTTGRVLVALLFFSRTFFYVLVDVFFGDPCGTILLHSIDKLFFPELK